MSLQKILFGGAGGAAESKTYVDDLYSSYLYNGNASARSIPFGLNFADNAGMVMIKRRNSTEVPFLFDTLRGANLQLNSSATSVSTSLSNSVTAFNSTGVTLGAATGVNTNLGMYTSWAFRKGDKFFDLQLKAHTTGAASTVNLDSLGVVGMVLVKCTTAVGDWWAWHDSLTAGNNIRFNTNAAQSTAAPHLSVSGTTLTIAAGMATGTYVVYAWAHDTDPEGSVRVGQYIGNGVVAGPSVNLGWEPQYLLIKQMNAAGSWNIIDAARGISDVSNTPALKTNAATTESNTIKHVVLNPKGFQLTSSNAETNTNDGSYLYMAIRRSTKPPTSGLDVFMPVVYTGTNTDNRLLDTTIAPDTVMLRRRSGGGTGYEGFVVADRLRGQAWYKTGGGSPVETVTADGLDQQLVTSEWGTAFSASNGIYIGNATAATAVGVNINASVTANDHVALAFKRARGFYEHVTYTGTGVASRSVPHGLGVMPEFLWIRRRNSTASNIVAWHKDLPSFSHQLLLDSGAGVGGPYTSEITSITDTDLILGSSNPNAAAATYSLHMFASVPGVCSIGTYVGNGGVNNIDCGFAAGARFVLIKGLSGGYWANFDTARGISDVNGGGGDPILSFNDSNPESAQNLVGQISGGFALVTNDRNAIGLTYMYMAIA